LGAPESGVDHRGYLNPVDYGDYTEERKTLFEGLILDDVLDWNKKKRHEQK